MVTNLLVAMTLLVAAEAPAAEAVAEGLKPFQGVWTPESMEQDGKMLDPARLAKVRLSIDGEKFTFETANDSHSGLYKIDPTKDPKELDIHVTRGEEEGKVYLVIYKFEGGKMISACASTTRDAPTASPARPAAATCMRSGSV
jgi:uncharacterized protein (TIGR03067 family)